MVFGTNHSGIYHGKLITVVDRNSPRRTPQAPSVAQFMIYRNKTGWCPKPKGEARQPPDGVSPVKVSTISVAGGSPSSASMAATATPSSTCFETAIPSRRNNVASRPTRGAGGSTHNDATAVIVIARPARRRALSRSTLSKAARGHRYRGLAASGRHWRRRIPWAKARLSLRCWLVPEPAGFSRH
jgi:hypothetical protein